MVTPLDVSDGAERQSALATGRKLAGREHHHLLTPSSSAERTFLRNERAFIRK
jgi:hypothetical protein